MKKSKDLWDENEVREDKKRNRRREREAILQMKHYVEESNGLPEFNPGAEFTKTNLGKRNSHRF